MTSVELVGSRAEGRAHSLSDWDLHVRTDDFPRLAEDLPGLLELAGPLGQFWDPYSDHDAYMVILPGPAKLDICFFERAREWSQPWEVGADTLEAIDIHFWDWILWTEQKRRGGNAEKVRTSLANMFERMLRPMGVADPPETVGEALDAYLHARDRLEREFGISVPRTLEREVRPAIAT